jgi:hypothetical protein
MLNPGFMSNILLTPDDRKLLAVPDEEKLPESSIPALNMNPAYIDFLNNKGSVTFTSMLDTLKEFTFINREDIRKHMIQESITSLKNTTKDFLFKNTMLGINVNTRERLAKFQLELLNSYQADLFYILKNNISDTELTNSEIKAKHSTILNDDLTPEALQKMKDLEKLNPGKPITYNPDKFFYLLYNEFQIIRINIKSKPLETIS